MILRQRKIESGNLEENTEAEGITAYEYERYYTSTDTSISITITPTGDSTASCWF